MANVLTFIGLTLGLVLFATYARWFPVLFGGYHRAVPAVGGRVFFMTRRGAERYGHTFLGGVDPYLRRGLGPVVPCPGLILRRRIQKPCRRTP